MEMMLQTQNLCKYFRKQKAVNNVSLNIEKEQIYGLLGPNGAGKSTIENVDWYDETHCRKDLL